MGRVRRLLATGPVNGATEALERLLGGSAAADADALALVGDLGAPWSKADTYRAIFRVLGEANRPAFWVPGPADAPLADYLRESANMEVVFPHLHGVHGTVALAPGPLLFAGMGGEVVHDPEAVPMEEAILRYPSWEVEYRLKIIRELKDYPKVFLFATQPAHKGLHGAGSEALAELIKTYNPELAIVAGDGVAVERLAKTLVVAPGRLDQGQYALVDLDDLSVEAGAIAEQTSV